MSELNKEALSDELLESVAGGRKDDITVAYEVINGNYGNGEERVRRLRAAGYDPYVIQSIVNQIIRNQNRYNPYLDPYYTPGRVYVDPYL